MGGHTKPEIRELARLIALAEWAPDSYRDLDGNYIQQKIELAIMHGATVGLGPIAAVQSIAVIEGMPTIWGDGALSIVERSGLLEDMLDEYELHPEEGLTAIEDCPLRVVLLHYSPTMSTLQGEPEPIWTYLGTNRLDGPIQKHKPDLVLHGHAHAGTFAGAIGQVPVYNVAVHVMRRDFFVFELDSDAPDGHGARLEATA